MQFSLHAVLSALLLSALAYAVPGPIAGTANINCRDPAMIYRKETKTYYMFSSGQGIKVFKAPALNGPWKQAGYVMPNNCSKIQMEGRCDLWGGDISKIGDKYVLYYSMSKVGSATAAIGVATSKTMDPGSWTDHGEVLRGTGSLGFIAIGPNLIQANGTLKLLFGSHMAGFFQVELSDFKTLKSKLPGKHIAGYRGYAHIEGGFLYKSPKQDWYYFFFSQGITLFGNGRPGKGGEYKVRVGRSKSPSGPFLDKTGDPLTVEMDPRPGSIVLESHDNIYAPGGQSLFWDPVSKRDVMTYHYVKKDKGGSAIFGINYMDFSSGWPKVVARNVIKP
ncbi:glycoside hydrolase family 43 protein [Auricularia subglabra TFB-10046 SS5]|nr:glycoside hydrolase family 43 protein [Auricularia subglabra TFB-10046 SS5]